MSFAWFAFQVFCLICVSGLCSLVAWKLCGSLHGVWTCDVVIRCLICVSGLLPDLRLRSLLISCLVEAQVFARDMKTWCCDSLPAILSQVFYLICVSGLWPDLCLRSLFIGWLAVAQVFARGMKTWCCVSVSIHLLCWFSKRIILVLSCWKNNGVADFSLVEKIDSAPALMVVLIVGLVSVNEGEMRQKSHGLVWRFCPGVGGLRVAARFRTVWNLIRWLLLIHCADGHGGFVGYFLRCWEVVAAAAGCACGWRRHGGREQSAARRPSWLSWLVGFRTFSFAGRVRTYAFHLTVGLLFSEFF